LYLSCRLSLPLHAPFGLSDSSITFDILAATVQARLAIPSSPPFLHRRLLVEPLGGRLDIRSRRVPRVFAPAASQTTDSANRHVVIANDLTTQPDARQAPRR